MSSELELFIVYNNSTSFLGKLGYSFRRMSTTAEHRSACAASDLTQDGHGHDKPEWTTTKQLIPATVQQVHYDELPADLKKYVESNRYQYPCVVGRGSDRRYRMLLTDSELEEVADDQKKFLKTLQTKVKQAGLPWTEVNKATSAAT